MSEKFKTYEKAMDFAEKFAKFKNHGISNIYVIKTVDSDGNVTSESFGMNCFTNVGMSNYFLNNAAFPKNIYFGNGTATSYSVSKSTFVSDIPLLIGVAATNDDTTIDYEYPMYYNPPYGSNIGLVTCVCRFMTAYLPQTLTNVTDSIVISEIGIGTYNSGYTLWTHSFLYDISGNKIQVTKRPNETLNIEVFFTMSYDESLITSAWDNGSFMHITGMNLFFSNYKMNPSVACVFKNNYIVNGDVSASGRTRSEFVSNTLTTYTNLDNITLYSLNPTYNDFQNSKRGYIDGFFVQDGGFLNVTRLKLCDEDDEEYDQKAFNVGCNHQTNLRLPDDYFLNQIFGKDLQCTQLKLSNNEVYEYDFRGDKAFSCPIKCTLDKEYWFNDLFQNQLAVHTSNSATTTYSHPMYFKLNNGYQKCYLRYNMMPTKGITAIDKSTSISTVYATDKYWDCSSWIPITNFQSVPASAKYCKYWITNNDTGTLVFTREDSGFAFGYNNGVKLATKDTCTDYSFIDMLPGNLYTYHSASNPMGNILVAGNVVMSFEEHCSYVYNVQYSDSYTRYIIPISYGNWTCFLGDGYNTKSRIKYINTSDMTSPPTLNTLMLNDSEFVYDNTFDNSSEVASSHSYQTESGTGLYCFSDYYGISGRNYANKAHILDLRDSSQINLTEIPVNVKIAVCIWGTNTIAYIAASAQNTLTVYDVDNDTVLNTYDLTSYLSGSTPYYIFGHKSNVDNKTRIWLIMSNKIILVNTTDNQVTSTNHSISFASDSYREKSRVTMCEDAIVVSTPATSTSGGSHCLFAINPLMPNEICILDELITSITTTSSISDSYHRPRVVVRRVHNTIALFVNCPARYTVSGTNHYYSKIGVIDLGYYFDTKTLKKYTYSFDANSTYENVYFYDMYVIVNKIGVPLSHYLPHAISGKTVTLNTTSTSDIFNIKNIQWYNTITNIPTFEGKIPGHENDMTANV